MRRRAELLVAAAAVVALPVAVSCARTAAPRGGPAPASAIEPRDGRAAPLVARALLAVALSSHAPAPVAGPPLEGMVRLPAGYFLMGADDGEDAHPIHEVAVPRFDLDATEVTVAAYRRCVEAGSCEAPHEGRFCNGVDPERDRHPVNCVDANMAAAYCSFADRRLPTEEEWEYAARGGADHRRYSWGSTPPDSTNACYDHPGTCPVASFAPGAFGLFDVSGNVWEWTSSVYAPYLTQPTTGTHLVYRGGSWSRRYARWLLTGLRNRYRPEEWSAALGVRCARSVSPEECPDGAEGSPCVRVRGETLFAARAAAAASGSSGGAPRREGPGAAAMYEDPELGPIVTSRSPQFDGDCAAHWPKTPIAYRVTGGTFPQRPASVGGRSCSRRDVGHGYTGLCCVQ